MKKTKSNSSLFSITITITLFILFIGCINTKDRHDSEPTILPEATSAPKDRPVSTQPAQEVQPTQKITKLFPTPTLNLKDNNNASPESTKKIVFSKRDLPTRQKIVDFPSECSDDLLFEQTYNKVLSVNMNPFDEFLLIGTDTGLRIIDTSVWKEISILTSQYFDVKAITFSNKGTYLLFDSCIRPGSLSCIDGKITIVDTRNWAIIKEITFDRDDILDIVFSSDDSFAYLLGESNIYQVNTESWEINKRTEYDDSYVSYVDLHLSADGKYIGFCAGHDECEDVYIYDTSTWENKINGFNFRRHGEFDITFSPDGKNAIIRRMTYNSQNDQLYVFNTDDWSNKTLPSKGKGNIFFSSDGKYFISENWGDIYVYETSTWTKTNEFDAGSATSPYSSIFTLENEYIISTSNDLKIWDINLDKELSKRNIRGKMQISSSGRHIISKTHNGDVYVLDIMQVFCKEGIAHDKWPAFYEFVYNTQPLFVGKQCLTHRDCVSKYCKNNICAEKKTCNNPVVKEITSENELYFHRFDETGSKMFTFSNDKSMNVWDTSTWEKITTISDNTRKYNSVVSISKNGKYMVTLSCDEFPMLEHYCIYGDIKVRDTQSWQEIPHLSFENLTKFDVEFTPGGKFISINKYGYRNSSLELISLDTLEVVHTLKNVTSTVFAPDDSYILASHNDTIYKWETTSWNLVSKVENVVNKGAAFDWHSHYLTLSPDGKYLFIYVDTMNDEKYLIWDAETFSPIDEVKLDRGKFTVFSKDGKYVVFRGFAHVIVYNLLDRYKVLEIVSQGSSDRVEFSDDSKFFAIFDSGINIYETINWNQQHTLSSVETLYKGSFTKDWKQFVSVYVNKFIIWDVATETEIISKDGFSDGIIANVLSPDNSLLVIGSSKKTYPNKEEVIIIYDFEALLCEADYSEGPPLQPNIASVQQADISKSSFDSHPVKKPEFDRWIENSVPFSIYNADFGQHTECLSVMSFNNKTEEYHLLKHLNYCFMPPFPNSYWFKYCRPSEEKYDPYDDDHSEYSLVFIVNKDSGEACILKHVYNSEPLVYNEKTDTWTEFDPVAREVEMLEPYLDPVNIQSDIFNIENGVLFESSSINLKITMEEVEKVYFIRKYLLELPEEAQIPGSVGIKGIFICDSTDQECTLPEDSLHLMMKIVGNAVYLSTFIDDLEDDDLDMNIGVEKTLDLAIQYVVNNETKMTSPVTLTLPVKKLPRLV